MRTSLTSAVCHSGSSATAAGTASKTMPATTNCLLKDAAQDKRRLSNITGISLTCIGGGFLPGTRRWAGPRRAPASGAMRGRGRSRAGSGGSGNLLSGESCRPFTVLFFWGGGGGAKTVPTYAGRRCGALSRLGLASPWMPPYRGKPAMSTQSTRPPRPRRGAPQPQRRPRVAFTRASGSRPASASSKSRWQWPVDSWTTTPRRRAEDPVKFDYHLLGRAPIGVLRARRPSPTDHQSVFSCAAPEWAEEHSRRNWARPFRQSGEAESARPPPHPFLQRWMRP